MNRVSKAEFFATVGKLNVHPHILPGPYPYSCDWKLLNNGRVVGHTKEIRLNPGAVETEYYRAEDWNK